MNKLSMLLGQHTIDIPGNGIDQSGIDRIQRKLLSWGFGRIPDDRPLLPNEEEIWQWDWKVGGKGEYVGALPKRISKYIWQTRKEKLTPTQLSIIGNIGSAHSGRHCKYWFDVVNHADWEQSDFGQPDDCCYWGCHAVAKDMILDNGGGAIRFFTHKNHGCDPEYGFARAWFTPWLDCWIVFNGYGLETLAIARILAAHLNHAYYRRIELINHGELQGNLWINSGAYLVGPQESVLRWDEIDLQWNEPRRCNCGICGSRIDEEDHYHDLDDGDLCEECYSDRYFRCVGCDEDYWNANGRLTPNGDIILCQNCWEEDYFKCKACEKDASKKEGIQNPDGDYYCEECYGDHWANCKCCDEDFPIGDMVCRDDGHYCKKCVADLPKGEEEEENPCSAASQLHPGNINVSYQIAKGAQFIAFSDNA